MSVNFGLIFALALLVVTTVGILRDEVKKWRGNNPIPWDYDDDPKRCLYKTFIYVCAIDLQTWTFSFVIPGWYKNAKITKSLSFVPEKLRGMIQPQKRMYVRTNLGALEVEDLWFEDWEEE